MSSEEDEGGDGGSDFEAPESDEDGPRLPGRRPSGQGHARQAGATGRHRGPSKQVRGGGVARYRRDPGDPTPAGPRARMVLP